MDNLLIIFLIIYKYIWLFQTDGLPLHSKQLITMYYKVIELLVPDQDIQEQEHWYYDKKLTRKAAMEWFQEQVEAYEIDVPTNYLLRVLTFTQGGRYCPNLTRDIVRTI